MEKANNDKADVKQSLPSDSEIAIYWHKKIEDLIYGEKYENLSEYYKKEFQNKHWWACEGARWIRKERGNVA